jgi:hypothetical protein
LGQSRPSIALFGKKKPLVLSNVVLAADDGLHCSGIFVGARQLHSNGTKRSGDLHAKCNHLKPTGILPGQGEISKLFKATKGGRWILARADEALTRAEPILCGTMQFGTSIGGRGCDRSRMN